MENPKSQIPTTEKLSPEYRDFLLFLKNRPSFFSTIWRNLLAGMARGAGCVTIITVIVIVLIFIFSAKYAQ